MKNAYKGFLLFNEKSLLHLCLQYGLHLCIEYDTYTIVEKGHVTQALLIKTNCMLSKTHSIFLKLL